MSDKAPKVSIIGAGAVGATLAQRVIEGGIADVVLVDILKNLACGKALDLSDAAPIMGHERSIVGTDDYREIEGSDIVVVTAGLARKPGMTREDLAAKNASIVRAVSDKVKVHAPSSILIVVTNPLDAMTYLAYKTTGFRREKVFGMAGALDGSRLAYLLADELKVRRSDVKTLVLGSHGDTMVPVLSETQVKERPVTDLVAKETLEKIVKRTRDRGAEIVALLGSGSAYYSPSAAVYKTIDAILNGSGQDRIVLSCCLEGEYGLKDIAIGVPCILSRSGIKKIVEVGLSGEERAAFAKSAQAIRGSIEQLNLI